MFMRFRSWISKRIRRITCVIKRWHAGSAIRRFGRIIPAGVDWSEPNLPEFGVGISKYIEGLSASHRAELDALVGQCCTKVSYVNKGCVTTIGYANGDETSITADVHSRFARFELR